MLPPETPWCPPLFLQASCTFLWAAVLQPCPRLGRHINSALLQPLHLSLLQDPSPSMEAVFLPIHLAHWARLSLEDVDSFTVSLSWLLSHCLAQGTPSAFVTWMNGWAQLQRFRWVVQTRMLQGLWAGSNPSGMELVLREIKPGFWRKKKTKSL